MRELVALNGECAAVDGTLGRITAEEWVLPALGEWNVAELAAHMVGVLQQVGALLDEGSAAAATPISLAVYYGYDPDEVAPDIARTARDRAERVGHGALPGKFTEAWRAASTRAAAEPADRLVPTFRGPLRLADYLATRVLETVVHHMDLCAALGVPPVATPDAARLTMEVLEGLLGSRRPRNFGRARFIRAATGRLEVDDPRFPLLR